ncbi:TMEM175 family protein [Planctobacterium marinum]|uniref:TMEM175 family protein n=1 Tax=Planctobacterium marinum TaxID=1631968 RepID=UPI001E3CC5C0|nr:TMEM175 family protein [Planctobacterium marinum]MCC2607331.1 TMEM175 family protein [Planctobacterium marinum]
MSEFRGDSMSRIETFVAAAFAFAVSMLVISVDSIPSTFAELQDAAKHIPAFAASFAILAWIWHEHATWCRKYGLEDNKTIFLSCLLVFLVLVYIYPLRLMMQGLMGFVSQGWFPFNMDFKAVWQVRFLFGFYAVGFFMLSLTFAGLYAHAASMAKEIQLTEDEGFIAKTEAWLWLSSASICVLALVLAIFVPTKWIGFTGFTYFLLFPQNYILKDKLIKNGLKTA